MEELLLENLEETKNYLRVKHQNHQRKDLSNERIISFGALLTIPLKSGWEVSDFFVDREKLLMDYLLKFQMQFSFGRTPGPLFDFIQGTDISKFSIELTANKMF
jgi:hypothetical protein